MAMVCKYQSKTYDPQDTRYCVILADSTPDTFPVDGSTVDGLPDSALIDSGSVLIVLNPSSKYIMGSDKATWHKWEE